MKATAKVNFSFDSFAAEPTPKIKRPRKQHDLKEKEPRRSSRLSHHKPIEVIRRVRRKTKTESEVNQAPRL